MTTRSFAVQPSTPPLAVRAPGVAIAFALALAVSSIRPAHAEVVGFEITRRATDAAGIETIRGVLRIEIDPLDARHAAIADIALAPRDARGRVACEADIEIVRHADRARACGVAFIEAPNRGGRPIERNFGSHGTGAAGAAASSTRTGDDDADENDSIDEGGARFLLSLGYDIAWIGWQFDVERDGTALGLSVPDAAGAEGTVRATIVPESRGPSHAFRDLHGYAPYDADDAGRRLTVRVRHGDAATEIARGRWTLDGNTVTLEGGFEPGRVYELSYRPRAFPVAGLGLVALRDAASWLKFGVDSPLAGDRTLVFGLSQSGRLLNTVLRSGLLTDERGRAAFDGLWCHIAGAAGIDLDRRGATPTSLSDYETSVPPLSIRAMRARIAPASRPRTMHSNTSCEYWLGGRMAALLHVAADTTRDLASDADARAYFLAGTQHGPAPSIRHDGDAKYPGNPVETRWTNRALAVAWRDWLVDGTAPPADRVPRLDDGTLVPLARFAFPAIPGVTPPDPALVPPVLSQGALLPVLVPATDEDGNERAGIRAAELAVPLATFTGWNYRRAAPGVPPMLATLVGARIPFAVDEAARRASGDPRAPISARHASRDAYESAARAAIDALVAERFLLPQDAPRVLRRMGESWDAAGLQQPREAREAAPPSGPR